jgi:hypothetical protein
VYIEPAPAAELNNAEALYADEEAGEEARVLLGLSRALAGRAESVQVGGRVAAAAGGIPLLHSAQAEWKTAAGSVECSCVMDATWQLAVSATGCAQVT